MCALSVISFSVQLLRESRKTTGNEWISKDEGTRLIWFHWPAMKILWNCLDQSACHSQRRVFIAFARQEISKNDLFLLTYLKCSSDLKRNCLYNEKWNTFLTEFSFFFFFYVFIFLYKTIITLDKDNIFIKWKLN